MGLIAHLASTGTLRRLAEHHEISRETCPNTWRVRAIIAAHRDANCHKLFGPGYGPDWRLRIKRDVRLYLADGKLSPVVKGSVR